MDVRRMDVYEGIADKRMDGLHMYIHISIPFAFYVRFFLLRFHISLSFPFFRMFFSLVNFFFEEGIV